VGGDPSPRSAAAEGPSNVRNLSIAYRAVETDLLSPQFYRQRALLLDKLFAELQHLPGGRRRVYAARSFLSFSMREDTTALSASCADF
jgi:hypothetical protein